jgi:alkylation response protein AidB-like acyl-CoA dehydrogenase
MSEPFHWVSEHEEFRGVLRKLTDTRTQLADAPGPSAGTDRERELWHTWVSELGLTGLVVPEEHGGAGFSRLEMAIAAEELGRAVLGGPLFASAVLATEALLATGSDMLPALAEGTTLAALAVAETPGDWHTIDTTVSGGRLTGVKVTVLGAAEADVFVVAAREDAGVSLFLVERGDGVEASPSRLLDATRSVAAVRFSGAPARRVGEPGEGRAAVDRTLEAGAIFLAAEQVGGSRALLDAAVEHANTRVQFGRPIGAFQAVKHTLAEVAVRTEVGAAAAIWAAWQEPGSDAARLGAAVARAHCADAYLTTALDAIQVHGGMAITWEHHAHRYLRRARADLAVLPGPAEQRRHLATVIGGVL